MNNHSNWLNQIREDVVSPEIPIIDPHHHIYQDYGDAIPYQPDYLENDLAEDVRDGHNIVATVFVESGYSYRENSGFSYNKGLSIDRPSEETEVIENVAENYSSLYGSSDGVCSGIVGFAEISRGFEVERTLELHTQASSKRFCGVRQAAAWDPSPQVRYSSMRIPEKLLDSSSFREGFSCLKKYNLTFDAWVFYPQLNEVANLAKAFPDTTIVLDHLGGVLGVGPYAGRPKEAFREWESKIRMVSSYENVVIKLGGLGMVHSGLSMHERQLPPTSDELVAYFSNYFQSAIECFGFDRCMFESNFPIDKISFSYRTLWNAYKKFAQQFSASEKDALFRTTAKRVYDIKNS